MPIEPPREDGIHITNALDAFFASGETRNDCEHEFGANLAYLELQKMCTELVALRSFRSEVGALLRIIADDLDIEARMESGPALEKEEHDQWREARRDAISKLEAIGRRLNGDSTETP